jgi:hypothetical protein
MANVEKWQTGKFLVFYDSEVAVEKVKLITSRVVRTVVAQFFWQAIP